MGGKKDDRCGVGKEIERNEIKLFLSLFCVV